MLPAWSSLHPLVVHFPIALLLFSSLLVVLSLARASWQRSFVAAAVLALALGVASAWLAVATGKAAVHRTGDLPDEIFSAVETHEELAETTAWIFTSIALVYGLAVVRPAFLARPVSPARRTVLLFLFVALCGAGAVELVRTAHLGGLLVHRHAVRAKF